MNWVSRVLVVAVAMSGGIVLSRWFNGEQPLASLDAVMDVGIVAFVHHLALAISVGLQVWQTFVFGLLAFHTLPRRQFGVLQSKLFPAYFQLLTLCDAASLYCFYSLTSSFSGLKGADSSFQVKVLLVALATVLLNLAWLEPKTSEVMFARHRVEDQHPGASMEALKAGVPEFRALSKKFGMFHGLSSSVNLVSLAATLTHLWYLSTRLDL